ncbi:hypothetical protein J6Q66_00775 [bacterium]|nr:hypothetical protein [bacterium]
MTNISSINTYNFGADQAKKTNEPAKKIKSSNVAKEKGISKTAKTALITAGVALAALGIYIFSKGKKGADTIQNVTNKANDTEFTNPVEYTGDRTGTKFVLGSSNAEGTRFKPNIQGELCREFENTIIIPKTAEEQKKILREIEQEFNTLFEEHGKKLGLEKNKTTIYDMLRSSNYTVTDTCDGDYRQIIETVSDGMVGSVRQARAWYYHEPMGNPQEHPKFRITLNCKVDKKLIKFLDDFILENKLHAKYKMPNSLDGARFRPDTFNIYFQDDISEDLLNKLVQEATKYARDESKIFGVGTKLAEGVYKVPECNTQDIIDFYNISLLTSKDRDSYKSPLIREIKYILEAPGFSIIKPEEHKSASAGQVEAAKMYLRKYLEKCAELDKK